MSEDALDQLVARLEHAAAIIPSAWTTSMLFRECLTALAERDRRIAELEADSERLSWLDRDDIDFECGVRDGRPIVSIVDMKCRVIGEGETVRAAIDAARKGST